MRTYDDEQLKFTLDFKNNGTVQIDLEQPFSDTNSKIKDFDIEIKDFIKLVRKIFLSSRLGEKNKHVKSCWNLILEAYDKASKNGCFKL